MIMRIDDINSKELKLNVIDYLKIEGWDGGQEFEDMCAYVHSHLDLTDKELYEKMLKILSYDNPKVDNFDLMKLITLAKEERGKKAMFNLISNLNKL